MEWSQTPWLARIPIGQPFPIVFPLKITIGWSDLMVLPAKVNGLNRGRTIEGFSWQTSGDANSLRTPTKYARTRLQHAMPGIHSAKPPPPGSTPSLCYRLITASLSW